MAEPKIKNAELIRGVLDGGVLQFRAVLTGRQEWVDCGGDPDCWLSIIVCAGGADPGTHRIKPGSLSSGVPPSEQQASAPSHADAPKEPR